MSDNIVRHKTPGDPGTHRCPHPHCSCRSQDDHDRVMNRVRGHHEHEPIPCADCYWLETTVVELAQPR